ncbi:MAG: hypothetical protein J7495_07970 [Sphingomonas sp.]|nr:hypothetical protein [Sphingomonas sp.]
MKRFRKTFATPRLSAEGAERQSRITLLAWDALGPDAAQAFLNAHDDALGGWPLNLAVESAAGAEAVERAIAARLAAKRGRDE